MAYSERELLARIIQCEAGGERRQPKNKSFKVYELYNAGKLPENIKSRCCNFKLLEEKCLEYRRKEE